MIIFLVDSSKMIPGMRCILLFVFVLFGCTHSINIDFDDSRDGFFLKSSYHKFKPTEPNIVKETLILTHPAEVYKLRASYGPFEMYQSVPNRVLSSIAQYGDVWAKSESRMHRQVIHNLDVSAHLVGGEPALRRTDPGLQLLVHAQPLVRRQKQRLIYSYYGYSQRWCARMFVVRGEEQLTSSCVLGDNNACVVGLSLPDHWWIAPAKPGFNPDNSSSPWSTPVSSNLQEVLVFYDLSGVEANEECGGESDGAAPVVDQTAHSERKLITVVPLAADPPTEKKDLQIQNLVFRVTQANLAPGLMFEVPVLLTPSSTLKQFVVQVHVRGNIAIEGASTDMSSPWTVFFEAGDTDDKATVTALLKETRVGVDHLPVEVMKWQFRVLHGSNLQTTARVTWSVDPDGSGQARSAFFYSDAAKVSAKFNILSNHDAQIIPVLKERSLLNTAILSGKIVSHDLQIFSVSQDNRYRDITKDAFCRSLDPEVVKVSMQCEQVYLDGSERRGSRNVTIVVRSGDSHAQFSLRVWVPEPRLDIQLSDSKLSQVRRWKVPQQTGASRFTRSADSSSDEDRSQSNSTSRDTRATSGCSLKYQQAGVEVYARFAISTAGRGTEYYRSRKTMVRVTDMVLPRMRVANPHVAQMYKQTILGLSPGRTKVQVISPTGQLLGSQDVRVARDRVDLERLVVRVISGLRLHIGARPNLPGALLATVYLQDQLVARDQEAVVDIALQFDDGSILPLSSINPEEYDLEVTSVNPNVVEVVDYLPSAPSAPPSIKATGDGKGEIIKVTLREKDACDRKKPRTLDTEYVHVQVDFAKDIDYYKRVQSDGYFFSSDDSQGPLYSNKGEYFQHHKTNFHKFSKGNPKIEPVESKLEPSTVMGSEPEATSEPQVAEALEQPVSTEASNPSPLHVAMYVLVAVFVFACLVFAANCGVFMARHKRKCKPHLSMSHSKGGLSKLSTAGSISQAQDWVWVGRATLERQGNSGLEHPLMAEEDFNGNQMVVPNHTLASSTSGISSTRKSGIARSSSSSGSPPSSSAASRSSERNSMVSTYQGSECSVRITANPLLARERGEDVDEEPDNDLADLGGMGYNEAEWDYEAMGLTYDQLMDYFDNLKESSA